VFVELETWNPEAYLLVVLDVDVLSKMVQSLELSITASKEQYTYFVKYCSFCKLTIFVLKF